jgi:hypothetical protein
MVPVSDPDYLAQFLNSKNFVQNLAFSMLGAALFPRKSASNFNFFTFALHFVLDLCPNPVQEPVPVPLRQKGCGSCSSCFGSDSGSTTLVISALTANLKRKCILSLSFFVNFP